MIDPVRPSDLDARHAWWDLYIPATCGDGARVRASVGRIVRTCAPVGRGDAHAVAARSFFVLGVDARARRHATAAVTLGGDEAASLATWLHGEPERWIRARAEEASTAGARADACCDGAYVAYREGRFREAVEWTARALAMCHGHGEAGRWARALVHAARHGALPVADAVALSPTRGNGWVAPERFRRRVLSESATLGYAPADSGWGTLLDAGVVELHFALAEEHALLPSTHPLVELERRADRVRALVAEGRDPAREAERLWRESRALDEVAAEDAAHVIVACATFSDALVELGWQVSDWALREGWEGALLWRAYRSRHAAVGRRGGAAKEGRDLLIGGTADTLALRLALEAVAIEEGPREALVASARHAGSGVLARERAALMRGLVLPTLALVTPRLLPRGSAAST